MQRLRTIEWKDDAVRIVEQTRLPTQLVFEDIRTITAMYDAIKLLKVRGAPAIGIAAAFGVYLGVRDVPDTVDKSEFMATLAERCAYLASSRPTAVNLFWAIKRMQTLAQVQIETLSVAQLKARLLAEAQEVLEEDRRMCRQIGLNGFELLKGFSAILTHCNAGGLATAEYGTALAPVYVGLEQGKVFTVFADETRPLLQGSRITAFELQQAGVPVTLICDNMAATVMARRKVEAVIVGADRIAANGDTANKIGTYGVALLAKAHGIPFFVAAPFSTFDVSIASGEAIPIEERGSEEIIKGFGNQTAPSGVEVFNPAFDVTPHDLITAIITERGVLYPPFDQSIARIAN